jgi:glutamate synthase domain-containing protein 2
MSFGALGATATRALSDGVALLGEGALDNTGEGGLSIHHCPVNEEGERYRQALNIRTKSLGRDYVFEFNKTATSDGMIVDVQLSESSRLDRNVIIQLGPSMSGFKTKDGEIDWDWINFVCGLDFVVGIEIKLHQGAKPNDGGTVLASKLTDELAALRGIPLGEDYHSPERFPFIDGDIGWPEQLNQLAEFMDKLKKLSNISRRNLIIGLKTTYCGEGFASALGRMILGSYGPDYIQIDGAEGGTAAADTVMTDRVGIHTFHGLARTHRVLSAMGARDKVTLIASGRLVEPGIAAIAMSIGADLIASARGPLLSVGCIQARECHSGHCPSGIATHNSWRLRGLDPTLKSVRYANYILKYRSTLMKLARSAGVNIAKGESFGRRNLWAAEDKF